MATHYRELTLNGSGAGTVDFDNLHGQVAAIRVTSGTDTPSVSIAETKGLQQNILTASPSSATTYYPRKEVQDNTGAALVYASTDGVADRYQVDGTVRVTVSSGEVDGTIGFYIQLYS